eukprot:164762_1
MSAENQPIVVVGAGLTGCCITLLLSKLFKETPIILIESRDDYRQQLEQINSVSLYGQFDNAATRSINLALSHRGICALKACNIYTEIINKDLLVLMKGRYVHLDSAKISKQLYGQDHEGIYSISRLTLNCLFLDELSKCNNIQIKFKCKVNKVFQNGNISFIENKKNKIINSLFALGCDGAYSTVRSSLQRLGRYNFNITYVEHGYKELTIFPTNKNEFKAESNYLHIWPKHEFMLIGLPNPDKTFTCTLFAPWNVLETLNNEINIKTFFQKHFPDFIDLCPNYIEQCLANPSSPLAYVNLNKWNYKNKILLLGDAAHAIVPFYGQGMNAGFEDCLILYNMLKEKLEKSNNGLNDMNIEKIFTEFSDHRQPSVWALSKLSLQNYVEMRSLTAKQWFIYKKKLEKMLNWYAPSLWKPIYSMVAFSTIPYNDALKRAKKQDAFLSFALPATAIAAVSSVVAISYKYDIYKKIKGGFKWIQSNIPK